MSVVLHFVVQNFDPHPTITTTAQTTKGKLGDSKLLVRTGRNLSDSVRIPGIRALCASGPLLYNWRGSSGSSRSPSSHRTHDRLIPRPISIYRSVPVVCPAPPFVALAWMYRSFSLSLSLPFTLLDQHGFFFCLSLSLSVRERGRRQARGGFAFVVCDKRRTFIHSIHEREREKESMLDREGGRRDSEKGWMKSDDRNDQRRVRDHWKRARERERERELRTEQKLMSHFVTRHDQSQRPSLRPFIFSLSLSLFLSLSLSLDFFLPLSFSLTLPHF